MKKLIIILVFLCATISHAQITFEKYHPEIDKIMSVVQTPDCGYVLGTEKKSVLKLSRYGDIQWIKYLDSYNTYNDVISCGDSSILVVTTWDGNSKDIFLHKLSSEGLVIWTKRYGTAGDDYGYFIRRTTDNNFLIIGSQLIKVDADGNAEWQKENPVKPGAGNNALMLNTGNLLIAKTGQLNCISAAGELVWTKSLKIGNYSGIQTGAEVYYSGARTIYKLDTGGNVILSKPVSDFYAIAEADDSSFVIACKDSLIKLNTDLKVIWAKQIPNSTVFSSVMKTSDNGYFLTGAAGWVTKTDMNGDHKSLQIVSPQPNESVKPLPVNISWTSYNCGNINLDYSKDRGASWISIADNVQNTNSFIWNVPAEYADYILRISETDDPDVKDFSGILKVTYNSANDYIAANNIMMWAGSSGSGSYNPVTEAGGLYWPGGFNGNITAAYSDGLIWGGKVNGKINVNGSTYRQGLVPGKILENGSADERNSFKYDLWKLADNWEYLPAGPVKDRYSMNYYNWPGDLGAPYADVNNDGVFSKGIDTPDLYGNEVLWSVANDLDSSVTKFTYGSQPIGLEVQTTIYAINSNTYDKDYLKDVVFKKYKIINKGNNTVEDMFFGYWADADLGYANDDFVGVDTVENMAYCYNGDFNDEGYYGYNPPAIGYKIVQGPVLSSLNDSAYFNNKIVKGMKNLPAYAFHFMVLGNPDWVYAALGSQKGAEVLYNQMNGRFGNGTVVTNPKTNEATRFPLAGDPAQSGSGWYEGQGWPGGPAPEDRSMLISAGPFSFAPKDTQEVVIAIILARGTNHINSVSRLRETARSVQEFYNGNFLTGVKEESGSILKYDLMQNYPNPFNPATIIKYSIAEKAFVELDVYDILGKRVMSLVNEEKPAGEYQVNFEARSLASGVYYYRMKAGEYVSARKMLLIK